MNWYAPGTVGHDILDSLDRLGSATARQLMTDTGRGKSAVFGTLERIVKRGFASRVLKNGVYTYWLTGYGRLVYHQRVNKVGWMKGKASQDRRLRKRRAADHRRLTR